MVTQITRRFSIKAIIEETITKYTILRIILIMVNVIGNIKQKQNLISIIFKRLIHFILKPRGLYWGFL